MEEEDSDHSDAQTRLTADQEYQMMREVYDNDSPPQPVVGGPQGDPQASMTWDESRSSFVWKDESSGLLYLWDPQAEQWVLEAMAMINRGRDMSYMNDLDEDFKLDPLEGEEEEDKPLTGADWKRIKKERKEREKQREQEQEERRLKRLREEEEGGAEGQPKKKKKKGKKKKPNTSVYVKGLPKDVTEQELVEFFKKAGIIQKDPFTLQYRVKIYRDENDQPKGDALVTFLKDLSVENAFAILDGADFRLGVGYPVTLEVPTFENSQKGHKDFVPQKISKKIKRYDQEKELAWDEEEKVHVIVKHLFTPEQGRADIHFYDNLKSELLPEFEKCGPVQSLKIFERNPEGVVAVKYKNDWGASRCIEVMNGRFFDERQLEADYYDGVTDYFVPETEEEKKLRDAQWERWLQGNEEAAEAARAAAAAAAADEDSDGERAIEVDDDGDNDS